MKNFSKKLLIFLLILLPIFFVNFLVFTLAWSPPSTPPPEGNILSFLNATNKTQIKEAGLNMEGLFQAFVIQLYPNGAQTPFCEEGNRGIIWLEEGASGEKDQLKICKKNSLDNYAWEVVEWVPSDFK